MTNAYRGRGTVRYAGLALSLLGEMIDAIAKQPWRIVARAFRRAVDGRPSWPPTCGGRISVTCWST
ncbi:hypothetical protein E3O47_01280 [Cryobacterium sp. TMT2-17-1]|uniref:hypothetical protein n=1 Tax=unclassified Cryobacterium TaxID=2649013 RepID=UPI00106C12A5|nr:MULTISPECIES: hypothetical protein [unclassified Cryobacterium]TFB54853.1 hypothetical protein E3N94_10560 [Cryobacterium sp. Sr3]TFC54623.1 hypothetical protein E3O47_01280 [Cryobacterium sp. TMT2-17-1]TFC66030.1 hypothetical protein E3O54_12180 [Cryobacterium sp. TMT2-4]